MLTQCVTLVVLSPPLSGILCEVGIPSFVDCWLQLQGFLSYIGSWLTCGQHTSRTKSLSVKVFQVEHNYYDAMKVFQLIPPSLIILVP